jgi:hypothetical protein
MNRTLFVSIFALFVSAPFNTIAHAEEGSVTLGDLTVKSIATQYSDARVASSDIRQKSHEGSCTLLMITGANDAWDEDLYVKSVSDLGGGILTQTRVLVDNVNMAVLITGMNPQLQLMEHNSMWWDQTLTPVSEGIDSFKAAAKKAGYRVENLGDIACQSSSRFASRRAQVLKAQELRRKAAKAASAAKALEAGAEAEPKEEPEVKEPKVEVKTSPA